MSKHIGVYVIQCVPLATEPGISLVILTPMKILQRNLNRSTFIVCEMKRNVASKNPNAVHEEALRSEKIGVWCGMFRRLIIGPIFFDATITTAAYTETFNTFLNQVEDEELSIGYFQRDGATSHISRANMAKIQSFFGDSVISNGLWPPRSPHLTPPYCFLWGYLKGRIYQNHEP